MSPAQKRMIRRTLIALALVIVALNQAVCTEGASGSWFMGGSPSAFDAAPSPIL